MKFDPRISIGKSRDRSRNEPIYERPGAANPQFSHRRIRQECDLLHSLSQVIEYGSTAIQQRAAIHGRLDTLRGPIKQADPECMFQVRDRFRHDRLRDGKLLRRAPHAT